MCRVELSADSAKVLILLPSVPTRTPTTSRRRKSLPPRRRLPLHRASLASTFLLAFATPVKQLNVLLIETR